jgi:hypothetical protein
MPRDIPNEVVMARLSIQVAVVALESLFEKMNASPRTQKTLVSAEVAEACERLKAAQTLLAHLEDVADEAE